MRAIQSQVPGPKSQVTRWGWLSSWFGGRRPWRVALAGGLAGVMLLSGGLAYRQRLQRAEKARAELLTALQITSSKLNQARQAVLEVSRGNP